jgi:hypothetical protein
MSLNPQSIPQRNPAFRLEILDQEIILLRPSDGKIVQCNQTAGAVWQLCDGTMPASEIAALFRDAFEEPGTDVSADVYDALAALVAADVVNFL